MQQQQQQHRQQHRNTLNKSTIKQHSNKDREVKATEFLSDKCFFLTRAAHSYGELRNVQENERAARFYGELRSVAA